jgi:hypothetical protein
MVALALSHAAYGNGEGCSSSGTTGKGGSSSSQAAMGEGGSPPWMEDGIAMPVSVEDYIFEDNFFMEQHRTNMQVSVLISDDFFFVDRTSCEAYGNGVFPCSGCSMCSLLLMHGSMAWMLKIM